MAFVAIKTEEGSTVLVHTSVFDTYVPIRPNPKPWADVWKRLDDAALEEAQDG